MENKGWVVRRPDAADRRVNRLHLTAEAELLQVHWRRSPTARSTTRWRCCQPRERDQFAKSMRRVKRQLQAMIEPEPADGALTGRREIAEIW